MSFRRMVCPSCALPLCEPINNLTPNPSPPWGGEQSPPRGNFPLPIYFYIMKKLLNNNRKTTCILPSPPWGGEQSPLRGNFPLPIYFYITNKLLNNNRKTTCILPSPRWGGAGGEVEPPKIPNNITICKPDLQCHCGERFSRLYMIISDTKELFFIFSPFPNIYCVAFYYKFFNGKAARTNFIAGEGLSTAREKSLLILL